MDKDVHIGFGKVEDTRTIVIEGGNTKNLGVSIDVFPIDDLCDTYEDSVAYFKSFKWNWLFRKVKYRELSIVKTWTKKMAVSLLKIVCLPFSAHSLTLKNIEKAIKHSNPQSKYVGLLCDVNVTVGEIMERSIWDSFQLITFEGREFMAVNGIDAYLRSEYGDYMKLPPKEQQVPKHDPANNNYDFIDQLQTNKASKNIPLIFVSTESEKDTHVDIIQRGANAIIEKPFRTDYLKAITDRTLAEMQRMLEFSETSAAYIQKYDSKEFSENDKKFLQDAIDVLKAHYEDEDYSLDKLAKDLLVSRTQLYRKLKMLINTTPNDFITNYRMQQAEKMLKSSNQTISEIISKCGFRNRAFFYREFTRKHNCSPKDFRNKKEMTT